MGKAKKYIFMVILGVSLFTISSCTRHFCSDEDRSKIITGLTTQEFIVDKAEVKADKIALEKLEDLNMTKENNLTEYNEFYDKALNGTALAQAETEAKETLTEDGITETHPNYQELLEKETQTEFEKILNRAIKGSGEEKEDAREDLGTLYTESIDHYFGSNYPKACIALDETEDPVSGATIEGKNWSDAFNFGPVEGLLVYPIAWLIIMIAQIFGGTATAAVFGLIIATVIVRLLTVGVSLKSTIQSQKLTVLQPEIAKLQAKYQGSNDPNARNLQAQEMMKLYSKHGVNPFSSIIAPFLTLPVFIAMWGAVNGVALLRQGTFIGIELGDQLFANLGIGEGTVFNIVAWLILIVMVISQFVSMKLPLWLNKRKNKNKPLTDKERATQSTTSMMSNMMLIMIVGMGLFLPTAMSIYWTTSSLLMIIQQFMVQKFVLNKN